MIRCLAVCLLLVAGVVLGCAIARGDESPVAQERVLKLPEDGQKWHVSVVGDNGARYQEVLAWFDSGKLKDLKAKVLFHPVTSDLPIFKERYASNTKALPMVRVQTGTGIVILEVAGNDLPMTGDALYASIYTAASTSEELLPWRRRHSQPSPPQPSPTPVPDDPAPNPIYDNGNGIPILNCVCHRGSL